MQNRKRILEVKLIRQFDEDPDTSYLGTYSNSPKSEWSIDRRHDLDCIENRQDIKTMLEHAIDYCESERMALTDENCEPIGDYESWDAAEDTLRELAECEGCEHIERNSYPYFNPATVEKGNTPEENRQNAKADFERMESLARGDWYYLGIRAEAKIGLPNGFTNARGEHDSLTVQRVCSGGLWGTESDSDESYLKEIEQDELGELRNQLKQLGFSARAISTAFKNVTREDK
jgi:hypothetical protein